MDCEINDKEVDYYTYCKKCIHKNSSEEDDTCLECLTMFYRKGTTKPFRFKEINHD